MSCTRLSDLQERIFGDEHKLPEEWQTHKLADYLLLVAEKMETISYITLEMYVINPERREILIRIRLFGFKRKHKKRISMSTF
jgi:hypothetical protein